MHLDERDMKTNLEALWAAFVDAGITSCTLTYNGSGDDGSFDDPVFEPEEGVFEPEEGDSEGRVSIIQERGEYKYDSGGDWTKRTFVTKRVKISLSVKEACTFFAEDWLERHHGGWENNEGGYGTVTFDPSDRSLVLEHTEYVQTSNEYEHVVQSPDALEKLAGVLKENEVLPEVLPEEE